MSSYRSYCARVVKDVRAHCYCAYLVRTIVRTLFIGHARADARATSFSSARTNSKTQQNIERMTFSWTWCANIFVGCSVTPTFFRQITSFSGSFHHTKKQNKICVWEVLIISHILLKKGSNWCMDTGVRDLMTYVAKIYQIGLYKPC